MFASMARGGSDVDKRRILYAGGTRKVERVGRGKEESFRQQGWSVDHS